MRSRYYSHAVGLSMDSYIIAGSPWFVAASCTHGIIGSRFVLSLKQFELSALLRVHTAINPICCQLSGFAGTGRRRLHPRDGLIQLTVDSTVMRRTRDPSDVSQNITGGFPSHRTQRRCAAIY